MTAWYWRCERCGLRSGQFKSFKKYARAWFLHRKNYHPEVYRSTW